MKKRTRFIIVLTVLAVCFGFLYPTLKWYFWTDTEDSVLALGTREQIKDYAVNMATRDIDALIELARKNDPADLSQKYAPLVTVAKENLSNVGKSYPATWNAVAIVSAFPVRSQNELAPLTVPIMEAFYRDKILAIKRDQSNAVKLGLDLSGGMSIIIKADLDATTKDLSASDASNAREEAMQLAIESITGRIDRFGLSEPVVRQQGEDRIYVEIPGSADPDRINSIIQGRGLLSFHIVDDDATQAFQDYYRANPGKTFTADYQLLDPSIIPEDTEVLGVYHKDAYGIDTRDGFLAVKKTPALEGKYIKSVTLGAGRTNEPLVLFDLDSEGARIFADVTTKNVNKRLAIVSDGKIKSAPNIREPITGGSGSISGFNPEEANNLKTVLRTAWLNVPLQLENQQVVGASLGEESIRQGKMALFWGLLSVLIFMLLWYWEAGINACVAQILNLYIMFSVLSAFNLTLTLPSIAGMILTIGMAVDANVIIFERIKEELRLGKTRASAITAGFEHAFWAIMDSNVTTFIAALFLSVLGTGPIKGFAYSLAIGVVSSVFTALFVSRLMFDFGTQTLGLKTLYMGWRLHK